MIVGDKKKLRVAWFSPLYGLSDPKEETTSAYVTDSLSPYLKKLHQICYYHDGKEVQGKALPYQQALRDHREQPFDLYFYQIEDAPSSQYVRNHLAQVPGVVLFHDILFLRDSWSDPFGFAECQNSLYSLFSCERDLREYRRRLPRETRESGLLPYPAKQIESQLIHNNLPETLTVLYAGTPGVEHRAHYLLDAIRELPFSVHLMWLCGKDEEREAKRLIDEFSVSTVTLIPRRSPKNWMELLKVGDVSIHTLFSAHRDPGPYLALSLHSGVPCVLSNFSSTALVPNTIVFKIRSGDHEKEDLQNVLSECFHNRVQTRSRGKLASFYAAEIHDRETVAEELSKIFWRVAGNIKERMKEGLNC